MSKTTKILTTVVAIALVITAMVVGIYAATQGSASINANVSWTATAGITFTLDGSVANGKDSDKKSIAQIVVDGSTSNENAIKTADKPLDISFYDGTAEDGVNNPSNIVYTYTIKNTHATQAMKVVLGKAPVTGSNNLPVVAGTAKIGEEGTNVYDTLITETGVTLPASGTLTVTITLSLIVPADTSVNNFYAGVRFDFTKA